MRRTVTTAISRPSFLLLLLAMPALAWAGISLAATDIQQPAGDPCTMTAPPTATGAGPDALLGGDYQLYICSGDHQSAGLNALFADAVKAAADGQALPADSRPRCRRLGDLELPLPATDAEPALARGDTPLGHPSAWSALRQSLRLRSLPVLVVGRVGLAAVLAGGIGALFELERAYWAVAAAVLMLHQGLEGRPLLQRCIERLVGTWVGLLLAGALLWQPPHGLWLVALIMILQFTIEMVVLRNYALAVVFITAAALTLAAGGLPVPDLGSYLLARGVDTAVGCAVALAVFRLTWPRASAARAADRYAAGHPDRCRPACRR